MSLSMAEHIRFLAMEAAIKRLTDATAAQGAQIAALIATHPEPDKVRAILEPPPAAPQPEPEPVEVKAAEDLLAIPPEPTARRKRVVLHGENPLAH